MTAKLLTNYFKHYIQFSHRNFSMKKILCIIIINLLSSSTFATHWPAFVAPDKEFLLNHNYIDTDQCPAGEGKLGIASVNIRESLCKTFCPGNWNWIASDDGKCHNLASDFNFQSYNIVYYSNSDGTTSHSVVTAFYGKENSSTPIFKFIFTSVPGEYWLCSELNPQLHSFFCTNDI